MSIDVTSPDVVESEQDRAGSEATALDAYSSIVSSVATRLMPSVVSIRVERLPQLSATA
jgi:hypothetical protein